MFRRLHPIYNDHIFDMETNQKRESIFSNLKFFILFFMSKLCGIDLAPGRVDGTKQGAGLHKLSQDNNSDSSSQNEKISFDVRWPTSWRQRTLLYSSDDEEKEATEKAEHIILAQNFVSILVANVELTVLGVLVQTRIAIPTSLRILLVKFLQLFLRRVFPPIAIFFSSQFFKLQRWEQTRRVPVIFEGHKNMPENRFITKLLKRTSEKAYFRNMVRNLPVRSRLIVFFIQFAAGYLLPYHRNDGFKYAYEKDNGGLIDDAINGLFGGLTRWDGQYFLHIAVHGYTSEQMIAFFPLFPLSIGNIAKILHAPLSPLLSLSSVVIVVGVFLNFLLFHLSAENLLKINSFFDFGLRHLSTTLIYFFAFNPASIFFSALYTESMFLFITTSMFVAIMEGKYFKAIGWASLSTICRSNGILNICVCLASLLHVVAAELPPGSVVSLPNILNICSSLSKRCWELIAAVLAIVPFVCFQLYCIQRFCNKASCFDNKLPYTYVQRKYWNVGFLKYYEAKQLPNFLLATPVLVFLFVECILRLCVYMKVIVTRYNRNLIFDACIALYGCSLCVFCLFFINVQVSTRFVFSSFPFIYLYAAKRTRRQKALHLLRAIDIPLVSGFLQAWFTVYFIIGCVLFPLDYPWT